MLKKKSTVGGVKVEAIHILLHTDKYICRIPSFFGCRREQMIIYFFNFNTQVNRFYMWVET